MSSKSEHTAGTDKKAEGQKGVSQEQVGSGKDKDPNNLKRQRTSPASRRGRPQ